MEHEERILRTDHAREAHRRQARVLHHPATLGCVRGSAPPPPTVLRCFVVPASLYQRVLGGDFDRLPEVLRRFHGAPSGATARGTFRVERGAGRVRNWLATRAGLPLPGEAVALRLDVTVQGDEELWTRTFGAAPLRTRQRERKGRLVELHPPWALCIRLSASEDGMQLDHEAITWHGLRLPRCCAPDVTTTVQAQGKGWFVAVSVSLPVLGMVCRYSGEVHPAC